MRQQTTYPHAHPNSFPCEYSLYHYIRNYSKWKKNNHNDLHFLLIWKLDNVRDTGLCQSEVSLTKCNGDLSVFIAPLPWVIPGDERTCLSKQSRIKFLVSRRGQYVSWGCHSSQILSILKWLILRSYNGYSSNFFTF